MRYAISRSFASSLLVGAASLAVHTAFAEEWNFDADKADAVPADWSIRHTKAGNTPAKWSVTADANAPSKPNCLTLTETKNSGSTYNLAVADKSSFKDLDLSMKIRANSGKEDQGGGPIWRCKDENNYYICRFNPLEDNYRVYKVEDGKRTQLQSANVDQETGAWYTLRVTMVGDKIECYFDGEKLLDANDSTFKDAGMVGFWTKADAATSFDDLTVQAK